MFLPLGTNGKSNGHMVESYDQYDIHVYDG
jgi:hypothetical protein